MEPFISNNYLGSLIESKTAELARAKEQKVSSIVGATAPALPTQAANPFLQGVAPQEQPIAPSIETQQPQQPITNEDTPLDQLINPDLYEQSQVVPAQQDASQFTDPASALLAARQNSKIESGEGPGFMDSLGRVVPAFGAGVAASAIDTADTLGEVVNAVGGPGFDLGSEDEKRTMAAEAVGYDDRYNKVVMQEVNKKVDTALAEFDLAEPSTYKSILKPENLKLIGSALADGFTTSPETAAYSFGYIATAFVGGASKAAAKTTSKAITAVTKNTALNAVQKKAAIEAIEKQAKSVTQRVINAAGDSKTIALAAANMTNNQLDDYIANGGEKDLVTVGRMFILNFGLMATDKLSLDFAKNAINLPTLLKSVPTGKIASLLTAIAGSSAKLTAAFGAEFVQEFFQTGGEEFNKRFETELTEGQSALEVATSKEVVNKAATGALVGGPAGATTAAAGMVLRSPKTVVNTVGEVVSDIGEKGKEVLKGRSLKLLSDEQRETIKAKYDAESLVVDDYVTSMDDFKTDVAGTTTIEELKSVVANDAEATKLIEDSGESGTIEQLKTDITKLASNRAVSAKTKLEYDRAKDATYQALVNFKDGALDIGTKISDAGKKIASVIANQNIPDLETAIVVTQSLASHSAKDINDARKIIFDTVSEQIENKAKPSEIAALYKNLNEVERKALDDKYANNSVFKTVKAAYKNLKKNAESAKTEFGLARDRFADSLDEGSALKDLLTRVEAEGDNLDVGAGVTKKNASTIATELLNLLTKNTIQNPKLKNQVNTIINELENSEIGKSESMKNIIKSIKTQYKNATGEVGKVYKKAKAATTTSNNKKEEPKKDSDSKTKEFTKETAKEFLDSNSPKYDKLVTKGREAKEPFTPEETVFMKNYDRAIEVDRVIEEPKVETTKEPETKVEEKKVTKFTEIQLVNAKNFFETLKDFGVNDKPILVNMFMIAGKQTAQAASTLADAIINKSVSAYDSNPTLLKVLVPTAQFIASKEAKLQDKDTIMDQVVDEDIVLTDDEVLQFAEDNDIDICK